VSDAGKDGPPATIRGGEAGQVTGQRSESAFTARLLPWLVFVCLVGFLALLAFGIFQLLAGPQGLARATPTPAFTVGAEVKLVGQDGGPVTVWQMGGDCEVSLAFGEIPSGSDARIRTESCYNRGRRTTYHLIALLNGSSGWVEMDDIVPAAEYTPPAPTDPPEPTNTPWPTSTPPPTPTPTPPPLPMGSPLSAGNWGVRVDRVEMVGTLTSPSGDKTVEATGRFALIYMTVTNWGSRAETLHASSVFVEDAEGNRYGNDDLASAYASSGGCQDFALDIGPNESACVVAAIDIPVESRFYLFSLLGAKEYVLLDIP
jgi:hypothetical protein